jgi:excisionase family DNA binding protein
MKTRPHALPDYGRLLTPREAAAQIGLPVKDIYRLASARKITALRPGGRLRGIFEADLHDWLRRNRIEAEAPPDLSPHRGVDAAWRDLLPKKLFFPI